MSIKKGENSIEAVLTGATYIYGLRTHLCNYHKGDHSEQLMK